jgi:hypothetical protein
MDLNNLRGLMEAYETMPHIEEEKKKMPYVKMYRKAGNLGRDGSPEAMERSKKITGVMNKNAERVAAHRERDDAAKTAKKMKEEVSVDEKFSMAADPSKPEAPRPTRKAANKKSMSMKSRAVKAIGTQRRQDLETGITKESLEATGLFSEAEISRILDIVED